jgi:hypothetical protein
MKRLEVESPRETQQRVRVLLEEIQARYRSDRYGPIDIFSHESQERQGEIDRKRIIEEDNARQRSLNRARLLSLHLGNPRFAIDRDNRVDGDVAYLTDTNVTGLFDHSKFHRIDQRKTHQRIIFEDDNHQVAYIEFFEVTKGIDLTGFSEQTRVAKEFFKVYPDIPVKVDPAKQKKTNIVA